MALICWSLNWSALSEAQRGRVAVSHEDLPAELARLRLAGVDAVVLVSTCQRLDIYAWVEELPTAAAHFSRWCARRLEAQEPLPVQVYAHDMAARYLFRCAAGLQSIVVGEVEILGQLRRAWRVAQQNGYGHMRLSGLFTHALATGRRARAQTGVTRGAQSLESLALETVALHYQRDVQSLRWLVVGAGQMGQSVLKQLAARKAPSVRVVNRSSQPHTEPWTHLTEAIQWADAVIVCTGASQALIQQEHVPLSKALAFVDLALPANVAGEVVSQEGVAYWDLALLQHVLATQQAEKQQLIHAMQQILDQGWERYGHWVSTRQWAPFLKTLYAEVAHGSCALETLPLRQRLHPLVCALKQASTPRMQAYYQARMTAVLREGCKAGDVTAHG